MYNREQFRPVFLFKMADCFFSFAVTYRIIKFLGTIYLQQYSFQVKTFSIHFLQKINNYNVLNSRLFTLKLVHRPITLYAVHISDR